MLFIPSDNFVDLSWPYDPKHGHLRLSTSSPFAKTIKIVDTLVFLKKQMKTFRNSMEGGSESERAEMETEAVASTQCRIWHKFNDLPSFPYLSAT